jgi:hypothetical protein
MQCVRVNRLVWYLLEVCKREWLCFVQPSSWIWYSDVCCLGDVKISGALSFLELTSQLNLMVLVQRSPWRFGLLSSWTLSIVQIYKNTTFWRLALFPSSLVQWLRLAHAKGPNWVGAPCPTPEDGDSFVENTCESVLNSQRSVQAFRWIISMQIIRCTISYYVFIIILCRESWSFTDFLHGTTVPLRMVAKLLHLYSSGLHSVDLRASFSTGYRIKLVHMYSVARFNIQFLLNVQPLVHALMWCNTDLDSCRIYESIHQHISLKPFLWIGL